jgi:hypothetical protein
MGDLLLTLLRSAIFGGQTAVGQAENSSQSRWKTASRSIPDISDVDANAVSQPIVALQMCAEASLGHGEISDPPNASMPLSITHRIEIHLLLAPHCVQPFPRSA